MTLMQVDLDDKYRLDAGRIYLSGIQALVRLPMLQRERDRAHNLNTAGFISGYRGSPLGMYDNALVAGQVAPAGARHRLRARPERGSGRDRRLGQPAGRPVSGRQGRWRIRHLVRQGPGRRPLGRRRSSTPIRPARSRHGGVLALAGDDHGCQSSTLAHQSEQVFAAALMPILNPATLQDYLDLGTLRLCAVALFRLLGRLQGDLRNGRELGIDLQRSVPRSQIVTAGSDFAMPPGGLQIRWPDPPLEQERRLHGPKMEAVAAFARANQLDRIVLDSKPARLGIVATGKAYLDLRQALADLGITDGTPRQLGLRIYKVALTWPLEESWRAALRRRACRTCWWSRRSAASSKTSWCAFSTTWMLRSARRSSANATKRGARAAAERRRADADHGRRGAGARAAAPAWPRRARRCEQRLARLEALRALRRTRAGQRCSARPISAPGCPHNTSTKVPEGSRAMAGIGCHGMALYIPSRRTATISHMGGEGVDLDRAGPLHQRTAHLSEPRRRHLHPFRDCWRCAPPPRPASTSPTRFSITTRSR